MTRHRTTLLGLLLLYWAITLAGLDRVPVIFEDEPLIAASSWTLATEGRLGNPLLAGIHRLEARTYIFVPLFSLLQAPLLAGFGLGLFQVRWLPAALGLVVLALTYALGRRLGGGAVGLLAIYLLLVARLSATTPSRLTGIHLLDSARIARYDILVPVMGMAALLLFLNAPRRPSTWRTGGAGLLAGLAGLSHLYGLFWLPVLGLLALWERRGPRALVALGLGAALPWALYGLYVASDLEGWRGQMRYFAPPSRFSPLDWRWYLSNLAAESYRYAPGLGDRVWIRPALLGTLLTVLPALRWTARAARPLLVGLIVFPALLALLIAPKQIAYLISFIPLVALAIAGWGLSRRGWTRQVLLVLLIAVSLEGAWRIAVLARTEAAPYAEVAAALDMGMPPGRVLLLHQYWIGFEAREVRSWAQPIFAASPGFVTPHLPFERALDAVAPDAVVIDPRMRDYFAGRPDHEAIWERWRRAEGLVQLGTIDRAGYGRIEIYGRADVTR